MQIWAVDVSAYTLWVANTKGEDVIHSCLGDKSDDQSRVKRYLREIDQIRCLAGKTLIRLVILKQRPDLHLNDLVFQTTREGKPFLLSPQIQLDYNITHDGDWVAIAFDGSFLASRSRTAPRIGIDVMEIHLPHYEKSVQDFVETMDMTLTRHERGWILGEANDGIFNTSRIPSADLDDAAYDQLKKLYILWTYKEAYTKAKGIGLGYDFQNIEILRSDNDVKVIVEGVEVKELDIVEIVVPAGQSEIRKIGAGTGLDSLLVAMKLVNSAKSKGSHTRTAKEAVKEGLLRTFTMNELVTSLLDIISKKHSSNDIK